jgi:outer membrane PBP1 activator LpoA protein
LLLAIRALLHEGKLPQASQQWEKPPKNLHSVQLAERQLLTAELEAASKRNISARSILDHLDSGSLSANQLMCYYQAQIAANQDITSLPLIRAYLAQGQLLIGQAH